jgi:endonuclease/exonuclease/phosphatase family metal-dependent hydrolase
VQEVALRVTPRVYPHEYVGRSTAAEILAPEPIGPLLLVNHKPSGRLGFEHERELQAVAASRFVEELVGKREVSHVVLAGDFDAPDAASVRFWRGLQCLGGTSVCYRDAWESAHPGHPGQTFSPLNPLVTSGNWPLELGRRIDYVMVRCTDHGPTLDIAACERIFDEPIEGVWASDHFGIVAELAIPGPSSRAHY